MMEKRKLLAVLRLQEDRLFRCLLPRGTKAKGKSVVLKRRFAKQFFHIGIMRMFSACCSQMFCPGVCQEGTVADQRECAFVSHSSVMVAGREAERLLGASVIMSQFEPPECLSWII